MTIPVWRLLLGGIKSVLVAPPVGTGGTVSASYCYSVYLRHLVTAASNGLDTSPRVVVELGPGDSLGIGLMAMLTGADEYYAVDAVRHARTEVNLTVFDELVELLKARMPIPAGGEYAEIQPELGDYRFPSQILDEPRLKSALASARLSKLRQVLAGDLKDKPIRYIAPMGGLHSIPSGCADLILSQAVMEHIDGLQEVYAECFRCLGVHGYMSHQIDFRCHETAAEWNGHWKYSELVWKLMRGRRPWFINRQPCSSHLQQIRKSGFDIRVETAQVRNDGLERGRLAKSFGHLSDRDIRTAGVFVLACKPPL